MLHQCSQTLFMRKFILLLPVILTLIGLGFRASDTHLVKGTVKDEAGNALPNVTITEKGTRNGTSSGADGSYAITASDKNATLVF
jgi:hypothetical protein